MLLVNNLLFLPPPVLAEDHRQVRPQRQVQREGGDRQGSQHPQALPEVPEAAAGILPLLLFNNPLLCLN